MLTDLIKDFNVHLTKEKDFINIDILNDLGFIIDYHQAFYDDLNDRYILQLTNSSSISEKKWLITLLQDKNICNLSSYNTDLIIMELTRNALLKLL